jgi:hypothetical protein
MFPPAFAVVPATLRLQRPARAMLNSQRTGHFARQLPSMVDAAPIGPAALHEPQPASAVGSEGNSCFGKGTRFPRRAVGLYELERVGIDPYRIFEDGNGRNDAAFASVVGAFVLACIGTPLLAPGTHIEGPVSVVAGALLALWAVDSLAFDSTFAAAASAALQPRDRLAAHEAGHFLCAYLAGLPVSGYGLPGGAASLFSGEQTGVQVDLSSADVYDIAAVGMAGVAAECCVFGISEGGADDLLTVCKAVRESARDGRPATQTAARVIARWGLLQASVHLRDQAAAHKALSSAMRERKSLEECVQVLEANFDWSKVVYAS